MILIKELKGIFEKESLMRTLYPQTDDLYEVPLRLLLREL